MSDKSLESSTSLKVSAQAGGKAPEPTPQTPEEKAAKTKEINTARNQIVKAFIAQHGVPPDQIKQVIRKQEDGSESWEIIKKTSPQNRIYVAGPISGIPDHNVHAFIGVGKMLNDQGYIVFNPIHNGDGNMDLPYTFYLRQALKMLLECEFIYLLPGWENSKGASMEAYVAYTLNMNFLTTVSLSKIITSLNKNWFGIDLNLKTKTDDTTGENTTSQAEASDPAQAEGESTGPKGALTSEDTPAATTDSPE